MKYLWILLIPISNLLAKYDTITTPDRHKLVLDSNYSTNILNLYTNSHKYSSSLFHPQTAIIILIICGELLLLFARKKKFNESISWIVWATNTAPVCHGHFTWQIVCFRQGVDKNNTAIRWSVIASNRS